MDYITLALVGLLLLIVGFMCGSRYRTARAKGATRKQAVMAMVGGGGNPNEPH
jgi:hypothetical protein